MNNIIASDKIYVSVSKIPNAGRGVFAMRDIKKGEVIEKCPIIEIPKGDRSNLDESFLVTYFLYFGKNKERFGLMLGFGSIYNHSDKPNATFKIYTKGRVVEFVALKNINKDEEITFDYKHGSTTKSPLWFSYSL